MFELVIECHFRKLITLVVGYSILNALFVSPASSCYVSTGLLSIINADSNFDQTISVAASLFAGLIN